VAVLSAASLHSHLACVINAGCSSGWSENDFGAALVAWRFCAAVSMLLSSDYLAGVEASEFAGFSRENRTTTASFRVR
jgi:hypothetical protein